ncbi:hypothetical protein [Nodularia sphaerocarpa]|uniref:hypothetical protein n=1 Tax=Nodularia sphaerocarpa TaxID=137816 RepID=UPI001EFAB384|nr:hypothetical protein [Nodularia sphaerocarpa]MDB9374336.1 hypothetical protein [Nodularia sphaerocarpa CS-585]MDB9380265.1 hypothetical protein [Nodularia sphaerocarpa CS-585A2]ULP70406.1 hypothetical protein BDGGKGIB_00022 [Nodularia sphaerocarpa UHCC 0038]
MATINLYELKATGSELFQDSESFLNELNDVDFIGGGDSSAHSESGAASYNPVSDLSILTKLAEAFVATYAIGHITVLAKSVSYGH